MLQRSGKRLVVILPFEPDEVWGKKEQHHVTGSIQGHAVRGALERIDGKAALLIGPAMQRDTGLKADMQVDVSLEPEGPQLQALAADLVAALNEAPAARAFFESLATFYRKGYLRWVDGTRKPEARAARIAELIELLRQGYKERPRG